MFSDLVPITLEGTKGTCRLNRISNFETGIWDWSKKVRSNDQYDLVLGSEVFYDEGILTDIFRVLHQVLANGGTDLFCDPNRLGLDTIELGFKLKFFLAKNPLNWPRRSSRQKKKMGFLYELTHRGLTIYQYKPKAIHKSEAAGM